MQELIFTYNNCNGVTESVTGVAGILQCTTTTEFDMVFVFDDGRPKVCFNLLRQWTSACLAKRLAMALEDGERIVDLTYMTGVKNNG